MYNKLYNLLIEGLSGSSRAYIKVRRKAKELQAKSTFGSPNYKKSQKEHTKADKMTAAIPTNPERNKARENWSTDVVNSKLGRFGKALVRRHKKAKERGELG